MQPTEQEVVKCILTYELPEAVDLPAGSGVTRSDFRVKVIEIETFGRHQPNHVRAFGCRLRKDGAEYANEFIDRVVFGNAARQLMEAVSYERSHTADALRRTAEAISPTVSA